jgi:hypothetical protein
MKLFRSMLDIDSDSNLRGITNPDDLTRIVPSKERVLQEENIITPLTDTRRDILVHDLILIAKVAMTKVSARDQLWCDILAKLEKDIRRVVDETVK